MKTFYYKGDLAKYTGNSEIACGAKWFKIVMLEGHNKGKKFDTSRCPDCGLIFGQDKPANAPCHTCQVEEVKA